MAGVAVAKFRTGADGREVKDGVVLEDVPGDAGTPATISDRRRGGFECLRVDARRWLPAQQGCAPVDLGACHQLDSAVVELASEEACLGTVKVADEFDRRVTH